ncbi:unnamed protein product [Protopolystoma xenopodis]|uniref:Uncharacterized protein n=1 Tax=Protopolystoma xenopodis TaxID=117903 RepID=A0A3S5AWP0_9PLAT|nr:unnamed protein product [Protopolystoma xenopodis]
MCLLFPGSTPSLVAVTHSGLNSEELYLFSLPAAAAASAAINSASSVGTTSAVTGAEPELLLSVPLPPGGSSCGLELTFAYQTIQTANSSGNQPGVSFQRIYLLSLRLSDGTFFSYLLQFLAQQQLRHLETIFAAAQPLLCPAMPVPLLTQTNSTESALKSKSFAGTTGSEGQQSSFLTPISSEKPNQARLFTQNQQDQFQSSQSTLFQQQQQQTTMTSSTASLSDGLVATTASTFDSAVGEQTLEPFDS